MPVSFPVQNVLLDRAAGENLDRQLYRQLRDLMERRVLPSGCALPSTRTLSKDLGIGRNTVIAAYEQLALEGFLKTGQGMRPLVRELPDYNLSPRSRTRDGRSGLSERGRSISRQPFHHGRPGVTAFHPGLPDADNFPFNAWSKLLARRARQARGDLFGTYHVTGYPPLCEALARYLSASRGVVCRPEQIVVTNGAQSAFDLLARLLTDPDDAVWIEEPGYYGARAAFESAAEPDVAQSRRPGLGFHASVDAPACDLRDALLPSSARRHHVRGAEAHADRPGSRMAGVDRRRRLRQRISVPGPANPGVAGFGAGCARGVRRDLCQDPLPRHEARLHGRPDGHTRQPDRRPERHGPVRAVDYPGRAGGFHQSGLPDPTPAADAPDLRIATRVLHRPVRPPARSMDDPSQDRFRGSSSPASSATPSTTASLPAQRRRGG